MDGERDSNSKVSIIGSRGIPNKYGGFEGFTERLSVELVQRGHKVYVSCEGKKEVNCPKVYKGVNIFYFPITPPQISVLRMFYEVLYDFYALIWASRNADYIYMLGYSAGIFFFIPHLFGKKLIVNPDGIEWKRSKFNSFVQSLLKLNEKLMTIWSDEIVADSKVVKEYLDEKYDVQSKFIPYGVAELSESTWDVDKLPDKLQEKIDQNDYWLLVARLEPENNIHMTLEGYLKSDSQKPMVVVGNYSSSKYQKLIEDLVNKEVEDKTIIFTGGIYEPEILDMLRQNCYAYMHGHSVGGTNPSLLEAMINNNLILAHDNEFNREVCLDSTLYYNNAYELSKLMDDIDSNLKEHLKLKDKAYHRVKKNYSWYNIVEDYDGLFSSSKPFLNKHEDFVIIKNPKSKYSEIAWKYSK
jgi:rhamnosyltransferase